METIDYKVLLTTILGTKTEKVESSGEALESFVSEIQVPAGTSESALIPGGISQPRYLIVFGGEGISFSLVTTEAKVHCNPVGVISDRRGIQNLPGTGILINNSAAQAVNVTVVAVE